MEALAALSLAATIVQLVDFSSKVLKGTHEIYKSGHSVAVGDLKLITNDLLSLTSSMDNQLTKSATRGSVLTPEERAIIDLSNGCGEVARSLLTCLNQISDDSKNRNKVWDSFVTAVKTLWTGDKIRELEKRLDNYRNELSFRIIVLLDSRQRKADAKLDAIAEQQQQIVEVASVHLDALDSRLNEQLATGRARFQMAESNANHRHAEIVAAILTLQDGSSRTITAPLLAIRTPQGSPSMKSDQMLTSYSYLRNEGVGNQLEQNGGPKSIRLATVSNNILGILSFREMNERHWSIDQAHKDTFEWLFSPPQHNSRWTNFPEWLSSGTGCYWINGKAGSGKSTLMKFINQHPQLSNHLTKWAGGQDIIIGSFFFWYAGTSLQKSQAGLLRSLLYQLLHDRPGLIPSLFPHLCGGFAVSHIDAVTQISLEELKDAFRRLLDTELRGAKVFFVVDGIDEYTGDHHQLAELFSRATRSDRVKILLSSRPIPSCIYLFSNLPSLKLQDLTVADIKHYAEDKLSSHRIMQQLESRSPNTISSLVSSIVSRAWGVFLWVAIVVKTLISGLEDYDTLSDLHRKLDALPDDLQPLYSHMLSSMSQAHKIQGSKLLQLVLKDAEIQAHFPMTLLQLSLADDSNPQDAGLLTLQEVLWRCESTEGRLRSRCCGLVEVFEAPGDLEKSRGTVRFLHRTVMEFLQTDENFTQLASLTSSSETDGAGGAGGSGRGRVEAFDSVSLLSLSSFQEMRATMSEPDSHSPRSVCSRAFFRLLNYAKADERSLELCVQVHLPKTKKLMLGRWKKDSTIDFKSIPSNLPYIFPCPPKLFNMLLELVEVQVGHLQREELNEIKTKWAARLLERWISMEGKTASVVGYENGNLVRNILACKGLPNERVIGRGMIGDLETMMSQSMWEAVCFYTSRVRIWEKIWAEAETGRIAELFELFSAFIEEGAEVDHNLVKSFKGVVDYLKDGRMKNEDPLEHHHLDRKEIEKLIMAGEIVLRKMNRVLSSRGYGSSTRRFSRFFEKLSGQIKTRDISPVKTNRMSRLFVTTSKSKTRPS